MCRKYVHWKFHCDTKSCLNYYYMSLKIALGKMLQKHIARTEVFFFVHRALSKRCYSFTNNKMRTLSVWHMPSHTHTLRNWNSQNRFRCYRTSRLVYRHGFQYQRRNKIEFDTWKHSRARICFHTFCFNEISMKNGLEKESLSRAYRISYHGIFVNWNKHDAWIKMTPEIMEIWK